MKNSLFFGTIAVLVGTANAHVHAQSSMGGWGLNSPYNHTYTSGKETTVKGRIVSIDTSDKPLATMSPATDLKIRSNGRIRDVQLGPAWYFRDLKTHLAVGNTVSVTGNEVSLNGND